MYLRVSSNPSCTRATSLLRALLLPHPLGQGWNSALGPAPSPTANRQGQEALSESSGLRQLQLLLNPSGCVKNPCPLYAFVSHQKIAAPGKDSAMTRILNGKRQHQTIRCSTSCTALTTGFRQNLICLKTEYSKKWIFKYAVKVQLHEEVRWQFKCSSLILHLALKEYPYTNANEILNQTLDYVYTVISLKRTVKIQTSSTRWLFITRGN